MLDLSHIPNSQQDVQIFYSNGVTNAWQTWQKPRKCNYVWIMCIGGGGGGAGGNIGTNSNSATGGGSGGVARALYNAQQLPDILYVQVGLGGAGGAGATTAGAGSNGSAGTRSWVSLLPAVTTQNLVQGSGGNVAAGGSSPGNTAAGETVITQTTVTFFTLSNFIGTAGISSNNAGSFVPNNVTPLTSQITCPGGGGAGQFNSSPAAIAGASILSSSISPLIPGGVGTTVSGSSGGNGANGITSYKPFFSLGGAGGGNALSGSGGNGGNGGIGSGGGSGGSTATIGPGGRGGKGGDGLVVIISF